MATGEGKQDAHGGSGPKDQGLGLTNRDLRIEQSNSPPPSIAFAFDFPELAAAFAKPDADALAARKTARGFGVTGVLLVLLALMLATLGPLFGGEHVAAAGEDGHDPAGIFGGLSPHLIIGLFAAVLGLAGTGLGIMGMGRHASRRKWLHSRLTTETMRLFHFYYLAARLPEIVQPASQAPEWRAEYAAERAAALHKVRERLLTDPEIELKRIIARKDETGFDQFVVPQPAGHAIDPALAQDAEAAWLQFRLGWQAEYIRSKLARTSAKGMTLHQQEAMFGRIGWACIGVIIALHVVNFFVPFLSLPTRELEVAVISVALFALAWRALEDGFAPAREVERYEQYRANVRVAQERFEAATTFAAKLEVVRAFERTSLEEMRVFMRTHARARFLL